MDKINVVDKCLVCGGCVVPYDHDLYAKEFVKGMLFDVDSAVICVPCQAIYDDFGKRDNFVRVFKIVPFGYCHRCESANTKYDEFSFSCLNCGHKMSVLNMKEFKMMTSVTHGLVSKCRVTKYCPLRSDW